MNNSKFKREISNWLKNLHDEDDLYRLHFTDPEDKEFYYEFEPYGVSKLHMEFFIGKVYCNGMCTPHTITIHIPRDQESVQLYQLLEKWYNKNYPD